VAEIETKQVVLFFKLCSDHLSIEAIPRQRLAVDLQRIKRESLREHEVIMWTPQFVVLKNAGGQEITLRRNGRMVVRKAESEEVAREAASRVISVVLEHSMA
jgi:hypothetical protein